jgi:hypothetical protein
VVNNVVQQPNDAYTISGTTITFTSAPSAGTSNVYVRYLSTTTQAISPSQGTVGWAQLNSDTQQDLGISFKNRIINGNMVVSQRNGTTSVTASNSTYNLDRWTVSSSTSATVTVVQSTAAPAGFANSMLYTVSSGSATTSGQYFGFRQNIEAYNTADMNFGTANAKTFTVSFWVNCSLTGIYAATLANSGDARLYPTSFTVNAANTWEYKTITVAGDTTGTWAGATNGLGLSLQIYPSIGTSFRGTANVWNATGIYGPVGLADFVATTGNTFYITGVQLEVGTQATTFDYRSYGTELSLCQRYYNRVDFGYMASGFCDTTTGFRCVYSYPVQMRSAPTLVTTGTASNYSIRFAGVNSAVCNAVPTIVAPSTSVTRLDVTVASGLTQGYGGFLADNGGSPYLAFNSEL